MLGDSGQKVKNIGMEKCLCIVIFCSPASRQFLNLGLFKYIWLLALVC